MSVFRPAVRVSGPDGRAWEIYAYRIQLPPRRRRLLARLVVRPLWDLPRAGIRALGSDGWTIEAVSFAPGRTSLAWRTTGEYRGHVLARVEGSLARGETPAPQHAQFLGARGF